MTAPATTEDVALYPWKVGWRPWPADPRPPCWTCGAPPTSTFMDGSPRYDCDRRGPERHRPGITLA